MVESRRHIGRGSDPWSVFGWSSGCTQPTLSTDSNLLDEDGSRTEGTEWLRHSTCPLAWGWYPDDINLKHLEEGCPDSRGELGTPIGHDIFG